MQSMPISLLLLSQMSEGDHHNNSALLRDALRPCPSTRACLRLRAQAYWPFHKPECRRNEFADATEASEPKFANWMRKHGKLAVLKDDEVDRLERASTATTGTSR